MHREILLLATCCLIVSCENSQTTSEPVEDTVSVVEGNVLSLEIAGLSFSGPSEIGSGWTTV